ncbi:MAG TPA: antibiotic biosynthesis monooxygenase [Thermoanaerobaculia bacterium]
MIARVWRGRTPAEKADAYAALLERTGLTDYRATPGNRGVLALRRIQGDVAEFELISFWESFEAIRRFAGPDEEKAFYYPEDDEFLLEKEPRVAHFEVLANGSFAKASHRKEPGSRARRRTP